MQKETVNALKWIVTILNENNISYRIGGGLAVYAYGGNREVNDIDISLSGKHFPTIIPLVRKYIVAGPKHYKNRKWDCDTLSLRYDGQDIDLTDVDTLLMSKKNGVDWVQNKEIYIKHEDVISEIEGIKASFMHPKVLLEYKRELDGLQQEQDVAFLENYIKTNNI